MTTRYITRNGKRLHLVSSAMTKPGAKASAKAIKAFTHSSKSAVVKLSKKQRKREEANYGVYIGG